MYLEQQMDEVNNKLDLEWEQHLDRCKSGGGQRLKRLEKASKETVYRVLVNHTNIIESQKTMLEQLEQQIKDLKMRNIISGASELISDEENIEKLSASLLEKTRLKAKTSASPEAEMKKVVEGFSPEKTNALRQYLERKGTTKVKPDPELSKTRGDHLKTPKSKDMIKSLVIPEAKGQQNKVKQTLDFQANESPAKPFSSSGTSSGFAPVQGSTSKSNFSFTPVAAPTATPAAPAVTKAPPSFASSTGGSGSAFGSSGFSPFGASTSTPAVKPVASVASTTAIAKPAASTGFTTAVTKSSSSSFGGSGFSFGGTAATTKASLTTLGSNSSSFGVKTLLATPETATTSAQSGSTAKTTTTSSAFGTIATLGSGSTTISSIGSKSIFFITG